MESKPQEGLVEIIMARQGVRRDMLLPVGDSTVIVSAGRSSLVWKRDSALASEGNLHVEFRDGRSPLANQQMRVNQDLDVQVMNGGFFTYDVFLTSITGVEVFRGGGGVEVKPKGS